MAVAIVGYFRWSFGVFGYTDRKATAESLARSQMEWVKQETFDNTDTDGDGVGVYSLISYPPPYVVNVPPADLVNAVLQKITVIVSYPNYSDSSITDSLTLEGYKLKR